MTCTLPRQGLYAPNSPPPPAPLISHNHHIQVQKALSGTVSCTNRAYARDTSRGLRVLCTSPAYARDRLVRDRRLQNSGFYTRQACAQVRLMHATLRYNAMGAITSFVDACHCVFVFDLFSVVCVCVCVFLVFFAFSSVSDADECLYATHDCHVNGLCTNTNGSFSCACVDGFTGPGTNCTGKPDVWYLP